MSNVRKAWVGRGALIVPALLAMVLPSSGQELRTRRTPQTQSEMHGRVLALYNFHPAQVSEAERQAKSKEMDIFWSEMKVDQEKTLPLLRTELRDTSDPTFFFTDGTELLLSLSKDWPDEELAAVVLPRVDLTDTQPSAYFYTVHGLACDGVDATAAALHMLDNSRFSVSVPQHALTLDRRTSLMYVLFCMKPETWVAAVRTRFAAEGDAEAKLALLFALFYAETDDADRLLAAIADDPSQPPAVHKQAQSFKKEAPPPSRIEQPENSAIEALREKRRLRAKAVSDEAMDDIQKMSRQIAKLRAKAAR